MKRLKRIMALVIAMAMVLAMAVPVFATSGGTGDNSNEGDSGTAAVATAPTKGSITVESPVVSATYNVYKVFDMTTNADVDSFAYTIDNRNPFYNDIVTWANTPDNGLVLREITTEAVADDPSTTSVNEEYHKFTVEASSTEKPIKVGNTTYGNFDPQVFGQMLLAAMTRETDPVTPTAAKDPIVATVDKSDKIQFTELPLGYYLVNATYPNYTTKQPTLGEGNNQITFEKADFVIDENTDQASALSSTGLEKIDQYVEATVTDAYVDKYLKDKAISTNKDGTPLDADGIAEYKADLIASMKADATQKVLDAYNNDANDADINVKKPVLVFLDSSQPDAVINEKNEINKWDVPVNPEGSTEPGTPDHGEPEGGKNIVVQEATQDKPAYYADWSEAKTGDPVHYQLRVNAMNYIRNTNSTTLNQANAESVQQVKEYFIADYQSAHMHYDASQGIKVSIWSSDNNNKNTAGASDGDDKPKNVTKKIVYNDDGTVTITEATELDYSTQNGNFFMNSSTTDDGNMSTLSNQTNGIFGNKSGIMIPWTFVEKAGENYTPRTDYPIYTINKVAKDPAEYETEEFAFEDDGETKIPNKNPNGTVIPDQFIGANGHIVNAAGQILDEDNNPIQKYDTYYVYSIYNSDVTIVVDYYMILDDNAIVDEPGNKNFAQFAWNPVDNTDDQGNPKKPTNPKDEDKPSEFEEIDDATVYTCAIAWVKTDNKANPLAGAEFELPFYVKKQKDGKSYVYAMSNADYKKLTDETEKAKYTNKVTTTTDADDGEAGVITVKGITSTKDQQATQYKITETKAPDGYNKMTEPFYLEAKKSDVGVHTTTKTKIYKDAKGNITNTETETFVEFVTDTDSFNNENTTAEGEENSVPVYQFKNIVNEQGTELPSTGGIGTTIFYVVGTILVIGAGVILITRRRMDA